MRNIHVKINYVDGGKTGSRTFSITPDVDSEGLLLSPLTYNVSVRTWVQNETTRSGVGDIKICNADGELDDFVDEVFIDVTIYEVIDGVSTQLAYGLIDRVVYDGDRSIVVKLKDATKVIDIPLQDDFFPASETSDTGSGTNTYYALEGQPRPISIGRPKSVKPVLAKRSNNEYHCAESQIENTDTTYDNGVSVTHTDRTKGFTLSVDPAGIIVADIRGLWAVGETNEAREIDNIFELIFDKHSITNYSSSDLTTIDTDKPYKYSYYQDNNQNPTIRQVIKWFCDSFTGWFYTDEDGDIRFGYLQEPAVSADVDVSRFNVVDGITVFDDTAPNITTKIGSTKNWYVYNSDDIASGATTQNKIDLAQSHRSILDSANTLDDFYTDSSIIFDTLINGASFGQDEIDFVVDLYSQKRKFYAFNSTVSADIGQTVELTYPRYGLDSGVNLLVVGKEIDFINNTYKLTLWG